LRYALGKVVCLGSSSEGNAYYVEINRKGYPTPFTLLIECGFKYSELSKRLLRNNLSIRNVNAVLVSHEHHDHSLAVPKLVEYGKKVFAPKSVFEHYGVLDQVKNSNIMESQTKKSIADEIDVIGLDLEHKNADGSKTYNLGYIIQANCDFGTHNIFFATDTYFIKYDLSDWKFHTIFLEANNFTRNIIMALKGAKEKGDKFREIHFDRVLHSHMLVENTIKTLLGTKKRNGFDLSETEKIFLIHLSASGNVNPYEIKTKVIEKLTQNKRMRNVKRGTKIYISPKIYVFKKSGEII
jgi:L-ascorbate metabolism protein UlaG (beta-lactamase superfamily)